MARLLLLVLLFLVPVHGFSADVPKNAVPLIPLLWNEYAKFFPEHPFPITLATQIEQETCYSDTHSRCFSTLSRLDTWYKSGLKAEEGRGLGQVTIAWDKSGKIRVDTFSYLKSKYPTHLGELNRSTILQRADIQLRAIVLLMMENFNAVCKPSMDRMECLALAASAYNGGLGHVRQAQKVCGMTKGCDPNRWEGHVAVVMRQVKSNKAGLYSKSNYAINIEYVDNILRKRNKCRYVPLMQQAADEWWAKQNK